MADSRDSKAKMPPPRWPTESTAGAAPARNEPAAAAAKPGERDPRAGRIVHDERGNAVWNWVKETGRFCIDSTSALLKKLDFGDLKVEGEKEEGLRVEDPARDAGGGYDPEEVVPDDCAARRAVRGLAGELTRGGLCPPRRRKRVCRAPRPPPAKSCYRFKWVSSQSKTVLCHSRLLCGFSTQ